MVPLSKFDSRSERPPWVGERARALRQPATARSLSSLVLCLQYQLANLAGTLHASRVNVFRLKRYHARLMLVQKDEELVDDMQIWQDDATVDARSFASLFLAADHE